MIDGAKMIEGTLAVADRLLGERLGPQQPRAALRAGAERAEEDEALDTRAPGRVDEPPGGDPAQLLDRALGLVADRRRQVDHGVDAAQRVAERGRVGEVAERDLHAHAILAEPARIAHQAAQRHLRGDQTPAEGASDQAACAGEEQHAQQRSPLRIQSGT